MTNSKLLEEILSSLSVEEAFKHIEWLTEEVGERIAGTKGAREAARYIKDTMDHYGLETELQEFYVYNSHPLSSELKVLMPEQRVIDSQVQAHIASTLPEGVEGELVYIGPGAEEDYEGKDVRGKILLAELSYAPPRPEKARIAASQGAKALIIMNWGREEDHTLPKGAVKAVWGNPTPETIKEIPQIPVIGITRAAGEYLRRLLQNGPVKVWLRAEATREWEKIVQPIGKIEGAKEPEKFILVSGHFEAWGKGATCNATGNGLMLELARLLTEYKDQLRRSVVFAFWNGHEIAEAAGSTWYVDNFWDDITENAVAYINIDSPGLKGTRRYQVRASLELKEFVLKVGRKVLKEEIVYLPMKGKIADQSFYGVGVPSIAGRTVYDAEELKKTCGATLGWWYHSDEDTLDKVDREMFTKSLRANAGYIIELCNTPLLPMEFISVAKEITQRLRELETENIETIDITSLIQKSKALEDLAGKLDSLRQSLVHVITGTRESEEEMGEIAKLLNRCLMRLSRILMPMLNTIAGKYGQDSYGLSALNQLIPCLHPITKLTKLSPEEEEFRLLETKLLRERNKVSDALREAGYLIEDTIRMIKKEMPSKVSLSPKD